MRRVSVWAFALLSTFAVAQQEPVAPPRPAQELLTESMAKAKKEDKVVFLAFHASWCGWCKRLEKFLDDKDMKPIIDKHMVVLWLDCQEREGKKNLENPGVDAVVTHFDAEGAGLPSMHIIDGVGKMVATSIRKEGGNIGYPGQPDEIAHFLLMLKVAKFTEAELKTIEADLKARAAKLK
jgi:thioredoxin-related protein